MYARQRKDEQKIAKIDPLIAGRSNVIDEEGENVFIEQT